MIFPDLPKHYQWQQTAPELVENRDPVLAQAETPLREPTEPTGPSRITVEEWWIKHGLAQDPAAASTGSAENSTIDWWSKDALEFYALSVCMICWTVFWYGIHTGAG